MRSLSQQDINSFGASVVRQHSFLSLLCRQLPAKLHRLTPIHLLHRTVLPFEVRRVAPHHALPQPLRHLRRPHQERPRQLHAVRGIFVTLTARLPCRTPHLIGPCRNHLHLVAARARPAAIVDLAGGRYFSRMESASNSPVVLLSHELARDLSSEVGTVALLSSAFAFPCALGQPILGPHP